jgi:hypothetical protein
VLLTGNLPSMQGIMSMKQIRIRPALRRHCLVLLTALLASCAILPPPVSQRAATEDSAESAAHGGDHARAATQYESLAASRTGTAQVDMQLSAAREWLAANRPQDAARIIAALNQPMAAPQSLERSMIEAESLLLQNRAADAWQRINAIPDSTGATAGSRYYPLRMRIALAADRPVDGIRAEMTGEHYALNPTERTQLRTQLLQLLRAARDRGIKLDPQASTDNTVRGWLELGAIASEQHGASIAGGSEAAAWRAKYPNHPAAEILPQAVPAPLVATMTSNSKVALLLPLTGPAAGQAATIRDGFQAAYDQLPAASRPELKAYDTSALPPAEAIATARAAGSTFIVGPLLRDDVAAVASAGSQPIPVLALNYLSADRAAPSGLYQFALSPENEARLIARRMIADGHHRGIALVPKGEWGARVVDAFTRELTADGGNLLAQAEYDPAETDYGYEIQSILRVSDSAERQQRLQSALGTKLNFEPRHRADIEFIFVITERANNARLLVPQLKYFYAGDIPTYALSNAYEPDSLDANRDIDGLMYPDMPWMIADDNGTDSNRAAIGQAWEGKAAWRSRLFAFGYDACQLMVSMSAHRDLAQVQVSGLTGELHLDPKGHVLRDLIWVQARDGEPRRLPPSSAATTE